MDGGKRKSGWREEDESESRKNRKDEGRKVVRQKGKSKGKKKSDCEVVLF